MSKSSPKAIFQCQSCGYTSLKWLGKCPDCSTWNSFVEEKQERTRIRQKDRDSYPVSISDIDITDEERLDTGIDELNRVLGGGIVPGSLILIGGDPGIGKSTIMLQMLNGIFGTEDRSQRTEVRNQKIEIRQQTTDNRQQAMDEGKQTTDYGQRTTDNKKTALYVSGEESLKQIKLRARRLNIDEFRIVVLSETCVENVLEHLKKLNNAILIIDSIQTVYTEDISSAPGSVGQVRESAYKLMLFAKKSHIPTFIVGHVTKEGAIAGPRVLEHIVDTVLYFEGDRGHSYRILRTVKNRFGSTNEIGVFEMTDRGLREITNPSELFLSERPEKVSGTTVVSTIEGTRPIMVEAQALVSQTTFGIPRRTSIGVDINRVNLLIAVLEKISGLHLGSMDVFLNVVGGLKITEPAFDLGILLTIASSFREIPIKENLFVFGEVGLSGEIRAISQAEARIQEGAKIGFKEAILPLSNLERLKIKPDINLIGVKNIYEALDAALSY